MEARFTNQIKNEKLEDCYFLLLPLNGTEFKKLDWISSNSDLKNKNNDWVSYNQLSEMRDIFLPNKGTVTWSKYRTGKGLINRIKKELNN